MDPGRHAGCTTVYHGRHAGCTTVYHGREALCAERCPTMGERHSAQRGVLPWEKERDHEAHSTLGCMGGEGP